MNTVTSCLRWAEHALIDASSDFLVSCKIDSQLLLAYVLEKNTTWLRTWPEAVVSDQAHDQYQNLMLRRIAGEPIAYIVGRQGFWSLDLQVTFDTLVPRPDTELLVDLALKAFDDHPIDVLDLGTGSGAIALALACERPGWKVMATDVYRPTLDVASANATRLNLPVQFLESSWFDQIAESCFDLIVSNPPYIEALDEHLSGVGVRFEPDRALVSGADGLDAIREIVATSPQYLKAHGWLMLEHGYHQGDAVRDLLSQQGFINVYTHQDLADNDRVSLGQWMGPYK